MLLNDAQIKRSQTRETRHALKINTNINFVLEHK